MRRNNSRAVGNAYERQIRKEWENMGWSRCVTSRYGSKATDDQLVDLLNTQPFSVQIKRWAHAPAYQDILRKMPQDSNYNIIIHKKPNRGEVVVLSKEDFYEIIQMLVYNGIIKPNEA